MIHTEQQWQQMQKQITKLRKQNQQLKKLLQIQLTRQKKRLPSLVLPKRQFQSWKQEQSNKIHQSDNQQKQISKKNINQLKKQWARWSCMLQASILSKNHKLKQSSQFQSLRRTSFIPRMNGSQGFHGRRSIESIKSRNSEQVLNLDIKTPTKSQVAQTQQLKSLQLIEDIFLFGPCVQDIQKSQQRKFTAGHQLYYPQNKRQDFQIYGTYLFPNELQVKHIRQKNYNVQVNKMIFKNNKKLDCNVFIFQSQQNNAGVHKQNSILNKINPSKWLYALSIQFSDFLSVKNSQIQRSKINRSQSLINQGSGDRYTQVQATIKQNQFETDQKDNIQGDQQLFKSHFCLCIMTYYPFIRFLKDILIEVFDSVKLRRMNAYNTYKSFKQIDIFFFIKQLKEQLSKFLANSLKIVPQIGQCYDLNLNEVKIKLDLKQTNLINQIVGDWAFKILKILDKQSLLDIFCYTMMEECICFVCQDNTILTFIILLYVVVFTLPFGYPHPCVSIVFNDQLLQTPFTAILGINKGTKWIQENLQFLTQSKQNKIIINLNQEQVKIKTKKKPRIHKSEKLKKIFHNFYRRIQGSALPSIFKKKIQLISRQTTRQQNQNVFALINDLTNYYQDQLLKHLPNPEIIKLIKQSYSSTLTNPNQIYQIVIEKIQKYLLESRKSKDNCKDSFIDMLIMKQPFRLFIDRVYKIR